MSDPISVSRSQGILEVVLDRPKANAIDAATSRRMGEVFAAFRDDFSDVCVGIRSTGSSNDRCALRSEYPGDRRTNAARGAGHQRNLSGKVQHLKSALAAATSSGDPMAATDAWR